MLQGMAAATFLPLPYLALMSPATFSQASALRLETTTLAPCSASRCTMASPIPLVEPVTRQVFPVRSKSVIKASPTVVGYLVPALLTGRAPGETEGAGDT